MSTSKIINDFNKCLFIEKYYDFKFNTNKFKKKSYDLKSLFSSIKSINSYNEFDSKFNDSLTTVEALNNPRLEKLSKYLQKDTMNNYEFCKKRINSSKKSYNIKTLDIRKYSNCVNFFPSSNGIMNLNQNNKIKNKRKNLSLKFKNDFEEIKRKIKSKYEDDKNLNIYNNNKFKDTLSSFLYHVNNITEYQNENKKSKDDSSDKINYKLYNNDLTRNLLKSKYNSNNLNNIREIKRFEVNISNIFLIQKPLITSIRGKILKNTKKRFKRPIRNIIKSNMFYDYKEEN